MPLADGDRILDELRRFEFADDARARHYLDALDNALDRVLAQAGRAFSRARRPAQAGPNLPSHVWLATGDPRTVTAGAGYLAFFHACPRSRHHRDPRLLAGFRTILDDVLAAQRDTGELSCSGTAGVERPKGFPPHPGSSHGQTWYLEPLLLGMNWLRDEFTPAERERIDRALYRTADFIAARPIHELDNRGVIVCAGLALCGRYFHEPRFLREAVRNFHGVPVRVLDELSGQICEGSGPDPNYSGTTCEYLYLYRILSGDCDIDPNMLAALKWFSRITDPNGRLTLCGAATRIPIGNSAGKIHDFLPALERYSDREPFLQDMIEQYLPLADASLGRPHHSICPTIWALFEHREQPLAHDVPAWYADMRSWYHNRAVGPEHFAYNEGYDSLYFPVRQAYTTCVALRSRSPFKDLQCWTWGRERPVIYPADAPRRLPSGTRAWAIDTAVQNVSGVKIPDFCWVEGDAPGLITRWEALARYYVFTPATTLIVTDGPVGNCEVRWVVDTAECGTPEPVGDGFLYPGRQGRLHAPADAAVDRTTEGGVVTFTCSLPATPLWFALSGGGFELHEQAPGLLRFRDDSGTYEVVWQSLPTVNAADHDFPFHPERLRITPTPAP